MRCSTVRPDKDHRPISEIEAMNGETESWTRAVAYLKAKASENGAGSVITVSYEDSPVLRDLGNGLLVAYLVDEGNEFSYVQNRHLVAAKASEDDLHHVAMVNLHRLAERHLRVQPLGSIFAVFMDGNFEASVLLLDTVWESCFTEYVRGEYLAALPTRDVLAFGDASNGEAVAELQAVIARMQASGGDHPVSTSLYQRRSGTWVPFAF